MSVDQETGESKTWLMSIFVLSLDIIYFESLLLNVHCNIFYQADNKNGEEGKDSNLVNIYL